MPLHHNNLLRAVSSFMNKIFAVVMSFLEPLALLRAKFLSFISGFWSFISAHDCATRYKRHFDNYTIRCQDGIRVTAK
jgi:hypothetical protein